MMIMMMIMMMVVTMMMMIRIIGTIVIQNRIVKIAFTILKIINGDNMIL